MMKGYFEKNQILIIEIFVCTFLNKVAKTILWTFPTFLHATPSFLFSFLFFYNVLLSLSIKYPFEKKNQPQCLEMGMKYE